MTNRNIIGLRLRKARRAAKPAVTQLDLVARLQLLGISIDQSAISKIEAGQRPVFDFEVAALAKALKLPVAYFFESTKATTPQKRR
ncbi:MAG: helix-turn-helix transcriptional regulator [Dehalococcoidales bacterium]|nr:helix-turn-helix transcriptional regulator [Dehalococcoidales bacterium]